MHLQAGCRVGPGYFKVLNCNMGNGAGGGYSPKHGIILCHDRLLTPMQVSFVVCVEGCCWNGLT